MDYTVASDFHENVEALKTIFEKYNDMYKGMYQVSNLGRVRSLDRIDSRGFHHRGRILTTGIDRTGYPNIHLSKKSNSRTVRVHRLVALTFIPNPDNKPQVNHKDEKRDNNNVDNLEWVTAKENINYGSRTTRTSKSKSKRIKVIYQDDTYEFWDSATEFEKSFGIGRGCINNVLGGRAKSSYGMRFEYA